MKHHAAKRKRNFFRIIVIILVVVMIMIIALYFLGKTAGFFSSRKNPSSFETSEKIIVTKETLPLYLESHPLTSELPDDGEIELQLYSFSSGKRVWEESYVLTKDRVYEGRAKNPDVIIFLDAKYVDDLGNICGALTEAREHNDIAIEIKQSTPALLWKYRTLVAYKDCLGL
jgi:uncharacterized protein YpmS